MRSQGFNHLLKTSNKENNIKKNFFFFKNGYELFGGEEKTPQRYFALENNSVYQASAGGS